MAAGVAYCHSEINLKLQLVRLWLDATALVKVKYSIVMVCEGSTFLSLL